MKKATYTVEDSRVEIWASKPKIDPHRFKFLHQKEKLLEGIL